MFHTAERFDCRTDFFQFDPGQMRQKRGGHHIFHIMHAAQLDLRERHERLGVIANLFAIEPDAVRHFLFDAEPENLTLRLLGELTAY